MKTLGWLAMVASVSAQAALLEFTGAPLKKVEESGVTVPLYNEAKIKLPGVTPEAGVALHATGAGLREKKIVLFNVNVYLAASYVDKAGKLPAVAMDGIKKSAYRAIHLTLLRDLGADKIRSAFDDSLKANEVDTASPGIATLLKQISFDVQKGQTITFVAFPLANGSQGIVYELGGKQFRAEGPALADQFWSIWFGKPADGGLERLKEALTAGL